MKKINLYILTVLFLTGFISCSEDWLDVNDSTQNPTSVGPQFTLPVALNYTAQYIFYDGRGRHANTLGNMMMYNWSQSDGYSWYYDEFQYLVNTNFYDDIWDDAYNEAMRNYADIVNQNDDNTENYIAISKIMLAYHFQMLVDAYGDIPYSEALQREENRQPKFDDAQEVYIGLLSTITEAFDLMDAAEVNPNALTPSDDDIMFAGNMDKWRRFGNTLKLRMLTRISGVSGLQSVITDEFNWINSNGAGFLTTDALVNPGYVNEEDKQSPFWASFGQTVAGANLNNYLATCATDYVLEYLTDTDDPRINYIYEVPEDGHLGAPQGWEGYPDGYTEEFVSNLGTGVLKGVDMGAPLFTLAETNFLLAEAVEKGFLSGNAKSLYQEGIIASFNYLGVEEDAAEYYTSFIEDVSWDASPNKLKAIITQKWIALNSINGFESWMEYNRTGYPENLPISLLAPGNSRPVRLMYPSREISTNGGNVPAQPDVFTEKVFWAN